MVFVVKDLDLKMEEICKCEKLMTLVIEVKQTSFFCSQSIFMPVFSLKFHQKESDWMKWSSNIG